MNYTSILLDKTLWEIVVKAKGFVLLDVKNDDVSNIKVDVIPIDKNGYKSAIINVYGRIVNANRYLDGINYLDGSNYLTGVKS